MTGRAGRVNKGDKERAVPRAAPGFGTPGDAIQRMNREDRKAAPEGDLGCVQSDILRHQRESGNQQLGEGSERGHVPGSYGSPHLLLSKPRCPIVNYLFLSFLLEWQQLLKGLFTFLCISRRQSIESTQDYLKGPQTHQWEPMCTKNCFSTNVPGSLFSSTDV